MAKPELQDFADYDPNAPVAVEPSALYADLVSDPSLTSAVEASANIVRSIFGAENVDDILGMAEAATKGLEDIIGVPFAIHELSWHKSAEGYDSAAGVFVVLNVKMEDGSEDVVTTGGENVLAQLYKLQQLKAIPDPTRMLKALTKRTSRGFNVLWLASVHKA